MAQVRYLRRIEAVRQISPRERADLSVVAAKYAFRANSYYLGLIDWTDPNDPIRRIAVPQTGELTPFGDLDPSDEESNYVAPGCQHKYPHTALLLCTEICGAYCRFCFRKRLFMNHNDEAAVDISPGLEYIKRNKAITNVLLTGGDPLFLSTRRLERILASLRSIPHVRVIRIGSKMPAFNPYRILDDPKLVAMLARYSSTQGRIYLMSHFNHARELTEPARKALDQMLRAGVVIANQTPILRGINDSAVVLAELMDELSFAGVPSYYFFQCRPTEGNLPFQLPLTKAYRLLEQAQKMVSGLAKRARLVMSHSFGKLEMVGLTHQHIYLRYHRARRAEDEGRLVTLVRDNDACWLDDLRPVRAQSRSAFGITADDLHASGLE